MNPIELFDILSRSTWRILERSHKNQIVIGEDAITTFNLNMLAALYSGVVIEDTRINEAKKGCDFELWIGSDSLHWFRYAVQAKKLSIPSEKYAKLKHKVGGLLQIDLISQYSKANRATPIYCFYNYSQKPHKWSCSFPFDPELLGCSVTPLATVRKSLPVRGGGSFAWMHQQNETLPWSCLVRCLGNGICGKKNWPSDEGYIHNKLPDSLRELQKTRTHISFEGLQDLFSQESSLRPMRLGVIDLDAIPFKVIAKNEDAWVVLSSMFSEAQAKELDKLPWILNHLQILQKAWNLDQEVFKFYLEICAEANKILPETEFISRLEKFDPNDATNLRIKSIILYLLKNLTR